MSSNLYAEDTVQGPPMIVATKVLRAPRARVGKIYGDLRLPRSVELRSVAAAAAGGFVGLIVWSFAVGIIFGYTFATFLYTVVLFGAAGLSTLYIQPLKGEPLWRWLLFKARDLKGGQAAKAHICTTPLPRESAGELKILLSCVEVAPGSFDERGAVRKTRVATKEADMDDIVRQGFAAPKTLKS